PAPPASPLGREVVIYLKDGRVFSGTLIQQTPEIIVLRIAGISTSFAANTLERYKILPTNFERYQEMRRQVDDTDAPGIIQIVDWLIARSELDLARAEINALRARFPNNAQVQRTQAQVNRLIELRDRAARPDAPAPVAPPPATPGPAAAAVPLLGAEQINLMKVFEVDLARPPQMSISRDVLQALIDKYAGHPLIPATREGRDAILRQSPAEALDLMFRLRAREFYPQVRVIDAPESIRRFRDDVHRPILMNFCATTACHGGAEAGRLVFATAKPNSDATVFTNLYILERFRTADDRPLVDWEFPERSVFLQMAMTRDSAAARHPVVMRGVPGAPSDAWKPLFRSSADRRFQAAEAWIRAMFKPRPDYAFDYQPFRALTPPKSEPTPAGR
ncbi:MAG: hypothetical protein JNJ48_00660, partial [Phycisphaerae bacterium]|nr:hypothetical protein [Phycisphaerae bacterium]